MRKQGYIKNRGDAKSEFEVLFEESIEMLQKLSSDGWTDFNEHDPGVTIIENVIYALTSLNYKSQFPISDVLVSGKGGRLNSGDNGLFIASEILTTNPVTDLDLRKLLIDRVPNVKNVWIHRDIISDSDAVSYNLDGLLDIYVELVEYNKSFVDLVKEKEIVVKEITETFHECRNVCEDLHQVKILTPFQLEVTMDLTVLPHESGEEVTAKVLYEIQNFLSKNNKFYSLSHLEKQNVPFDQIFEGPLLRNGFMPDSELNDKLQVIVPSEVTKRISQLKGIISVNSLKMRYTDNGETKFIGDKGLKVASDSVPHLKFPTDRKDLIFRINNTSFTPNLEEVRKQLSYIEALNLGNFKSASLANNRLGIPAGQKLDLAGYMSVRHQFPLTYGIGEFGLSRDEPTERYAQANQLKAFLMPFDQVMQNGLAQLANVFNLYDPNNSTYNSYAFQIFDDIVALRELIAEDDGESAEEMVEDWKARLQAINDVFDVNGINRLNQALDSLLGRFSEQFPMYELKKISYDSYGEKVTNDLFKHKSLNWKRNFVKNYGVYSYARAKGFNYKTNLQQYLNDDKSIGYLVPGVVRRVCFLLGIEGDYSYPVSPLIQEAGVNMYKAKDGDEILGEQLVSIYDDGNGSAVSIEDVVIINESVENLWDSFYYIGNSDKILKTILREGVNHANYQIRKTSGGKSLYYVTFTSEQGVTNAVHVSGTKDDAETAIDEAVDFLLQLNKKSEAVYLIEHILLAPPYLGDFFGFSFDLEIEGVDASERRFVEVRKSPFNERNQILQKIKESKVQFESVLVKGAFFVRIYSEEGEELAESDFGFETKAGAEQWIRRLKKEEVDGYEYCLKNFKSFAYYGQEKVDESFFTFRMSFVLPDWPSRFQDKNFKVQLNDIIYESSPAHIVSNTFWISLPEMAEFEKLYFFWLGLLRDRESFEEGQLQLCYSIIQKLKQYASGK